MLEVENQNVVEFRGISKWFPGVHVLDNISFGIKKGTVHALMGENGAGKSTLMKILNGTHKAEEGEIYFKGQKLQLASSVEAIKTGITMIYQELNLCNDLTVGENVFMSRLPKKKNGMIHWRKLFEDTEALLAQYNLHIDPKTKLGSLTVAQMQMIEIAKALSNNSELLIMDEPTSAIADAEVEKLFKFIEQCKSEGKTVIYISHRIHEIMQIADEVTILRDGKYIWTKSTKEICQEDIIKAMVGRELDQLFPKLDAEIGEVCLEVKGLTREGVFKDISFEVHKGEILGIAGLMGSKRTEIIRTIYGLDQFTSGEILMEGKPLKPKCVSDALEAGIVMVSEDRKRYGLVLLRSILENTALSSLKKLSKFGFMQKKKEIKAVKASVDLIHTKYDKLSTPASSLSGGNQQKVVVAKCLMTNPKLLIMDEPTRGIDVGSKAEIHRLIGQFAQQGLAVIVISSELPEVMGISDRIVVIHEGRQKGILDRNEFSQEAIMELVYK